MVAELPVHANPRKGVSLGTGNTKQAIAHLQPLISHCLESGEIGQIGRLTQEEGPFEEKSSKGHGWRHVVLAFLGY